MEDFKKILALLIAIAIVLVGVFLWNDFLPQPNNSDTNDNQTDINDTNNDITNKEITVTRFKEGSIYTYRGVLSLPTPCHSIKTETLVAESYPEQVTIKLDTMSDGEPCAEVISDKKFFAQFTASPEHTLSIILNGENLRFKIINIEANNTQPVLGHDFLELIQ